MMVAAQIYARERGTGVRIPGFAMTDALPIALSEEPVAFRWCVLELPKHHENCQCTKKMQRLQEGGGGSRCGHGLRAEKLHLHHTAPFHHPPDIVTPSLTPSHSHLDRRRTAFVTGIPAGAAIDPVPPFSLLVFAAAAVNLSSSVMNRESLVLRIERQWHCRCRIVCSARASMRANVSGSR
ncbi:hypothetical protein NL676_003243 [Syzygium grande]|nr:hypothetical protein NL676_003243 [Syzygium grande]